MERFTDVMDAFTHLSKKGRKFLLEKTWCVAAWSSLLLRLTTLDTHQLGRSAHSCVCYASCQSESTSKWRDVFSVEVKSSPLLFTLLLWKKLMGSWWNCCSRVNLLRKQLFIYKLGVNSSPLLGLLLWYLGAAGSQWPPAFTAAVTGSRLVLQCLVRLKPPTGAFQDGCAVFLFFFLSEIWIDASCYQIWDVGHSHKVFLPLLHESSLFVTSYTAGMSNSNTMWGKI